MTNISPPPKPDKIRSVVEEANIAKLLKTCSSKSFRDVRDAALIRLMIDAGPRLGEATHLCKDVDLRGRRAHVMGKRMQERDLVFGSKTALSLDHYLRARRRHAFADREELWLGLRGPLTESGVYQMLSNRVAKIRIHASPHQLRQSWAHLCKMQGMSDETLMVLGGWRSAEMLPYYGRSAAAERAALEHARLSPGNRF